MALLLRCVEQQRWLGDDVDWLPQEDAAGDEVTDLKTSSNELSVYQVPDNDPAAPVQIGGAILAGKVKVVDFDYFLFDASLVERLRILTRRTPGRTVDPVVNEWHLDLTRLSGRSLTRLACELRALPMSRVLKEDIIAYLVLTIKEARRFSREPQIATWLREKGHL